MTEVSNSGPRGPATCWFSRKPALPSLTRFNQLSSERRACEICWGSDILDSKDEGWVFYFYFIYLFKNLVSSVSYIPSKSPHAGLLAPCLWGVPSRVWWRLAHERLAFMLLLSCQKVSSETRGSVGEHMSEQLSQLQTGLSTPKKHAEGSFPILPLHLTNKSECKQLQYKWGL